MKRLIKIITLILTIAIPFEWNRYVTYRYLLELNVAEADYRVPENPHEASGKTVLTEDHFPDIFSEDKTELHDTETDPNNMEKAEVLPPLTNVLVLETPVDERIPAGMELPENTGHEDAEISEEESEPEFKGTLGSSENLKIPEEPENVKEPENSEEPAPPKESENTESNPPKDSGNTEGSNPPDESENPGESENPEIPDSPDESVNPEEPDNPPDEPALVSESGFLIDENQMIVGIDSSELFIDYGYIELPSENCIGIAKGAFASCTESIMEIYIPGNIAVIEEGAFCNLPDLQWLEVDAGNPNYTSVNGVVYNKDITVMLAFPGARIGTFEAPETLKRIGSYALDRTAASGFDMRKCGEIEVGSNIFGDASGEGFTIHAPRGLEEHYRNAFASYLVEIKGAGG